MPIAIKRLNQIQKFHPRLPSCHTLLVPFHSPKAQFPVHQSVPAGYASTWIDVFTSRVTRFANLFFCNELCEIRSIDFCSIYNDQCLFVSVCHLVGWSVGQSVFWPVILSVCHNSSFTSHALIVACVERW